MRPGLWQILLVIVLVIILFGSNKIPEMMRNLAGGINVFKKELKDTPDNAAAANKTPAKKEGTRKAVTPKGTVQSAPAKKTAAKKSVASNKKSPKPSSKKSK